MDKNINILIVEDSITQAESLKHLLEGYNYTVETASNGVEALEIARKKLPDMIITDALMPHMDGFQLCRELKRDETLKDIPVLFYSATFTDGKSRKFALDIGAVEYIIKPQEPDVFIKIINKIWDKYSKGEIKPTKKPLEEKVYMKMYNERLIQKLEKKILDLEKSEKRLQKTMEGAINTIAKIVETKDPYTAGHQQRVSKLAVTIAQKMKLPQEKIEGIRISSLVHDVGKISVPAEILNKPIKLSEIEYSLIRGHSQVGYDILKSIEFPWPIEKIVLQHHERLDGSGYPKGLKGDQILLEAKIMGVADVVEAMSSHRPYRPALGIDAALEEISQNKTILYDPEVVDVCLKLFQDKGFRFE